jgi:Rrf2 family protein
MRISAKADYAIRALAHITAQGGHLPVKAEHIALAQGIPLTFLLGILRELKNAHFLRSQRGADGGFYLNRPASTITLAEVIRVVDGPLANVRDASLRQMTYVGPAARLADVWMAVRAALRSVLDVVTIADLASGSLPESVEAMAAGYAAQVSREPLTRG